MGRSVGLLSVLAPAVALLAVGVGSSPAREGEVAGPALTQPVPCPTPEPRPLPGSWMATAVNIVKIRDRDCAVAAHFFNGPGAYAWTGDPAKNDPRALGYAAVPTRSYASYKVFKRDLERNTVGAGIRAVVYDLEPWPKSRGEHKRPVYFLRRFCTLAKTRGYACATLPTPDLAIRFKNRNKRLPRNKIDAYLRLGFAKVAALNADATGIQSQLYSLNPDEYRRLVAGVAAQARGANPSVKVVGELTPVAQQKLVPAGRLYTAWERVRDLIDGLYIAIPLQKCTLVKTPDGPVKRCQTGTDAERVTNMVEALRKIRRNGG